MFHRRYTLDKRNLDLGNLFIMQTIEEITKIKLNIEKIPHREKRYDDSKN
jgi:hypothetical protein